MGDAGGTSGGLAELLGGLAMACTSGYLLPTQVAVTSSFWSLRPHGAAAKSGEPRPSAWGAASRPGDARSARGRAWRPLAITLHR